MISNCEICDKEIEVFICCSGYGCGCMGQPTEPPVCSNYCFDIWESRNENSILKLKIKERKDKLINIEKSIKT